MSTTVTSRVRASVSTPHRELFLRAVTAMAAGTDQYHETDERFVELVRVLALADDGWLVRFLAWMRGFEELASAAVVGSAEMVRTRLANGLNTSGGSRKVIDSAFARADEPGLMLAYWFRRYGKTVPKPIRHGLADAAIRLYDEAALAEYDKSSAEVRFAGVIVLTGRTLILVDRSASMFTQIARGSAATVADQAAVFGACLALRAADSTLVQFGTGHRRLLFSPGQSLTELLGRFGQMGDGNAAAAVRACFDQHDRIVIVTDEPHGSAWQGEHPAAAAPADVPVYIWNVAGTPQPAAPGRAGLQGRYVFVGLSDAAFDVIPLIEADRRGFWPF